MAARERVESGESSTQAEHSVRREFGNVGLVENVTRDQEGWIWLDVLLKDLRFAARRLRKNPAFTAKSFWRLIHVNPGFETSHVISARLSLNAPAYDDARRERFWRQLEERVSVLPGVQAVGATSELPLSNEHKSWA